MRCGGGLQVVAVDGGRCVVERQLAHVVGRDHVDVGVRHFVAGDDHTDALAVERLLLGLADPMGDLEQMGDEIAGASIQWSTSSIGTTSTWPRASGLIDMNATQRSSRCTNVPGISPAMIRLKMVVMIRMYARPHGRRWRRTATSRCRTRSRCSDCAASRCSCTCCSAATTVAGAAWLLGGLGATDWVDGWLARRLNQTSEFGKMFDPTADRLLFIVGIGGIIVAGAAPLWVCWAGRHPRSAGRWDRRDRHACSSA